METKKKLLMTFKTQEGKKVSLSIENPRTDVSESEIKNVMTTIVNNDIFSPGGGKLKEIVEAKVVETDTIEYDLV